MDEIDFLDRENDQYVDHSGENKNAREGSETGT
jgi:hypothetical protein